MGLRGTSLAAAAALLAIGLFAASPFLWKGLVGTGEAFNYSLSIADAVTQMRHGEIPPLVGQTQYAFNGRIHPLRNAPYLYYLAAAVDVATFHKLDFWELQNASLVLSLVAAVFACYFGLRWATGCRRPAAIFLSGVYGLSPPLLCAAHQLDLFMTVHAAVFVPLAVAACIRGCRQPSFSADAWLAAALAAAWLAHPPVAFWTTSGVVFVRALAFLRRPSWQVLASAACAALIFAALSCFVFASAGSLSFDLGYLSDDKGTWHRFGAVILRTLRNAFPACILPISREADALGDLQFGYVPWLLTASALAFTLRRQPGADASARDSRFAAGAAVSVALFLLVLVLPVPFLTLWLWQHAPGLVLTLTTEWPMQRLYLVALGFSVFAAALVLEPYLHLLRPPPWLVDIALALAALWILYQAQPFVSRGLANQTKPAAAKSAYLPSNLDLTIISYAFVGTPPTFNHGVMDPEFEFRILQEGKREIASNLAAGVATAPVAERGELVAPKHPAHPRAATSQKLTLLPGHRYLLTFDFKIPPTHGFLSILGPTLHRLYIMPEAGQPKGFGMLEGERRTIPIWSDLKKPEQVEIRFDLAEGNTDLRENQDIAQFTLRDVRLDTLPVQLKELVPMRFTVDLAQTDCTVETPRRFLSGYEATVNGFSVTPIVSPDRQVMVPVPAGRSDVELRYVGSPILRAAFWTSAFSWAVFLVWRATGSRVPARPIRAVVAPGVWLAAQLAKDWLAFTLALAVSLGAALAVVGVERRWTYLREVGPVLIDFKLPYEKRRINQPLLATGHPGAGVIVFLSVVDGSHIQLGADVWGALHESGPLEVDFFKVQTLIVTDSALYPPDHPRILALSADNRDRLRNELRVELDGKVALEANCYGYESKPSEVLVGRTRMGSLTAPNFLGQIVDERRLPIPDTCNVPWGRHALMRLRFPGNRGGASEPLLSVKCGGDSLTYYAAYLTDSKLRICSLSSAGMLQSSGVLDFDPARDYELELRPEGSTDPVQHYCLACSFEGAQLLGLPNPVAPGAPSVIQTGLNSFAAPGVDARFTGPKMEISVLADNPQTGKLGGFGPAHIVVTFPVNRSGRHEPLLTTGRTGAGDFVYVVYEDEHHVRIGYDHWAAGAALSDPIPVDYRVPHELWICTGALFPSLDDGPAWQGIAPGRRSGLKSSMEVILDGKSVLSAPLGAYPTLPGDITVARNGIGGSTAEPEFTGVVGVQERTGDVLPPVRGL